ncbi:MAG TPA: asparagine synthase-related protein, partial [Armatimonadota bacterium]|nr:asparagine synthase-related protein [Armatimonadota bacterium]
MSGIAGIIYPEGRPVSPGALARMQSALAHRGPDGSEAWCGSGAGLVQLWLGTGPETRAPGLARLEGLLVAADARLDNRQELLQELGLSRDTPVPLLVAHAYRAWGADCVPRLDGDFALAVWDERERRLLCARDRFGVRPLYYAFSPTGAFLFASEIKGVLAGGEVPRRLNETRVVEYLTSSLDDTTATFYEGVRRLPPAHLLLFGPAGPRVESYWSLDPRKEAEGAPTEWPERFRSLFCQAVRTRAGAPGPVGAMLSGGLDSSSIVSAAVTTAAPELHTFSAVFEGIPAADERRYIEAVLREYPVPSHPVRVDRLSPLEEIEQALRDQDEPFYAPNLYVHRALYRAAAAQGVRVLLDGLDGDTTVSHGLSRLTELARAGAWRQAAQEIRMLRARTGLSPARLFLNRCVRPFLPGPFHSAWARLRRRQLWGAHLLQPEVLTRAGRPRPAGDKPLPPLSAREE